MNISQFTLWDVTVNVIPGILLLLLVTVLVPERVVENLFTLYSGSNILTALTVLILGYTFGRVFQEGISREMDNAIAYISCSKNHQSAKQQFSKEMSKARQDEKPTIRRLFLEESLLYFSNENVDSIEKIDQKIDDFTLFRLCQEYVIGNKIGRLNRFTILSRFHRSLYVMGLLGIPLLIVIQYAWPVLGYNPVLDWIQTAFMLLMIGIVVVFSFKERWYFEQKMTDSLINSFYVSRAESEC